MPHSKTQAVVFQPETHLAMLRGINQIVSAVRCTLGPTGGRVAIDQSFSEHKPPELLDSGGIITRRIIQLADRHEDMGAMLVRAMIARQYDRYGDGTATAAVLFQSLFEQGARYVTAGGNTMRLRRFLQQGLLIALRELDAMKRPVGGKTQITRLAETLCHDADMANRLGDIFDTVGEYGQLDIRQHYERGLKHEFVEGMYWYGGLHSRLMIADRARLRTDLENAALFISDFEIRQAEDLVPVVEVALSAGIRALIIVAQSLSEQAIGFLVANSQPDRLHVIAVKAPGGNPEARMAALEDLSILTGGRLFLKVTGQTTRQVSAEMFGRARRAWASHEHFAIIGGQGSARELRRHITTLETRFQKTSDPKARNDLRERIGKLMGGSATLWIGGATEAEVTARKALAERTASAVREALREGVLPGGGVALLRCRAALERAASAACDTDEQAAYRILSRALMQPAQTIFVNAGYDPGYAMAAISSGDGCDGFDVIRGEAVNTMQAGLVDVAAVVKAALQNAALTAALALTIDVLVHHKKPQISASPG